MIGNHAQFMGNLGNDPDFSYTSAGLARARFRLAVNDRQKQGDTVVPTTFWVTVTGFGKQAELVSQYLHKGSRVLAAGKLEPRTWTGADGKDRFDLGLLLAEIEFLDPRPQGGADTAGAGEELEPVPAGAL
ncbi:MAG TPA: single-stranded DNA-binding protein [Chloroflexota bacterium]|nr:single-stranded DNA-binding protein [Chloroflexota bacterium]